MTWGSTWLDQIETSRHFSTHSLRRGADYARYDWQLEVSIEPGMASTIARSGRRMKYHAVVEVPTLTSDEWNPIVERLAASTRSTAALLDGELPDDLGPPLFPLPSDIELSCSCQSNDSPCKHAAAVLYLLAEAIDEDHFELLHLRGLSRPELIERVTSLRQDELGDAGDGDGSEARDESRGESRDDRPELIWNDTIEPLPPDTPLPNRAGVLPPFPSDPPPTAGFTADGLRTLATDAAKRAYDMLHGDGVPYDAVDTTADMARRAAATRGTDLWKHLVAQSGVSSQELTARAKAWEMAGTDGVEAQVAPTEVRRMVDRSNNEPVQWRRTGSGAWVCFEKQRGRWEAVSAASGEPDLTLYDDSV